MTTPAAPASPAASAGAPGPAAPLARIAQHALFEARGLLSNGEQLMVAILLPVGILVGLVLLPIGRTAGAAPVDTAVAATAATALVSTCFTSQAIQTGFDRRGGVLRWVATTPLGRSGYLAGKILATLMVHAVQVVVLGAVALALGWRPEALGLLAAVPVWLVGTAAFGSLGLLVAGTLRTEAVLAVSNIVFVLLVAAGGIAVPAQSYPPLLRAVVELLPSSALGDLLRACLAGGEVAAGALVVLPLWAIAGTMLVVRSFRWTSV
ncbi:ABC transporter [Brachybacterium phenoliresistens]|uniref:ABC transporter n=1 Tax=Brachybacterium phenoliresistens TaxID=396014 RepID=Z9JXX7_9MICO|nr:ABC transporter permease [Brachybacterium phenoliresistens]EWS82863.1 ABC transporter [Brachybacterium phenoliresistens]